MRRIDSLVSLQVLDDALNQACRELDLKFSFLISSIGQKERETLVRHVVEPGDKLYVHVGVEVRPSDADGHCFLWSRYGLQNVVGSRGTFYPALGFRDAANFQSNVSLGCLQVREDVRNVVTTGRMIFVQFYAKSPHFKVDVNYPMTTYVLGDRVLHWVRTAWP